MRKLITYSLALSLLASCGVSFKTLTLEDNLPKPKPIIGLGDFKATTIFRNSMGDAWTENGECVTVEPTSESHQGDQAISLQWDRGSCEWTGFGIGWNAWAPKDLSQIMEVGAIEFYIRSIEKESSIPTIVFLLEDYGGVMSAAVFGSSCLERYPIDDQWQKATIPLSSFNYKEEGIDLTNIKQMVFELINAGAVIIDDMVIVEYQEREVALDNRLDKPSLLELELPSTLYDDSFGNVWGLGAFDCRDFSTTSEAAFEGSESIHMTWEKAEKCGSNRFGTSWTNWLAVDFSDKMDRAALDFWMKGSPGENALFAGIQAYNFASGRVAVSDSYVVEERSGWKHVRIPISEMKSGAEPWPRDNVKLIFFEVEQEGDVFIDNIQLISAP